MGVGRTCFCGQAFSWPVVTIHNQGVHMSAADKMKNATQDLSGKAKEGAGKVTDKEELQAQGKTDQTKAAAKKADENVKDVFKN